MTNKFLLSCVLCIASYVCVAQQPLPAKVYQTMTDSTNSIDVVFYKDEGGSVSADGHNVQYFNSFFAKETADKTKAISAGSVMWLVNGREYLSGIFFLGDSTGYLVAKKDGKEYVNKITPIGFNFLNGGYKKR
ncbi:MAG: hypothetical protein IPP77_15205 [Bacteroidetes bacterium]|nr:hypothetical protein [Bacteroidota bacterium]